jgi:CspA family cold shock protein
MEELMAKQTKKVKRTKLVLVRNILRPPSPSQDDFEQARELLGRRADALIMDLAKRYVASKAAELTTVLDAIDSLFEIQRLQRPAVGVTTTPRMGPGEPVSQSTDGGAGPPTASGILLVSDREAAGPAMATGTVKWFSPQKGFGFIVHTATGKDVFVHISAVEKAGLTKLNEGQQIEFELQESRGKASAVNLRLR